VLRVSLDELTRWSRELFEELEAQARDVMSYGSSDSPLTNGSAGVVWWTRRQVRERTRWPDRRVRECLKELVDMEYLEVLRGGSQGKTYVYQLAPHPGVSRAVLGLLTPEQLAERLAPGSGGGTSD